MTAASRQSERSTLLATRLMHRRATALVFALVPAFALLLLLPGCERGAFDLAFAPSKLARVPEPSFRSESPLSLVTTSRLLEITFLSGLGLPAVTISYPEPPALGDDRDGRFLALLVSLEHVDGETTIDADSILRALQRVQARALRRDAPASAESSGIEIDRLVLLGNTGTGALALAELLGRQEIRVGQVLHNGLAPRRAAGQLQQLETAQADLGGGRTRLVLAGKSLLASGKQAAERYALEIDAAPELAAFFSAALENGGGENARIERLFYGKPNLQWNLPTFSDGGPALRLVNPARDLWALADLPSTDRAAAVVLDLAYRDFRMLLLGDASREAQEEMAALAAGSSSWDATCIWTPTLPGMDVSRKFVETLDFQSAVGFGGGGGARYPPALLARRARAGDLHLSEESGAALDLQIVTDGSVYRIVALARDGAEARTISPWHRCLNAKELDGLLGADARSDSR